MSDLRDEIEKSFETTEAPEAGRPAADTEEPVRDTGEAPKADAGETAAGEGVLAKAKAGDAVEAKAPDGKAVPDKITADKPAAEPKQFEKAPASWKPGARERWMTLPADVRAEIHRREGEASQVMQETAHARQTAQTYQQMEQRFGATLAAEGMPMAQAVDVALGVISRLRMGTPVERAQTVANIIRSYAVDIDTLDNLLAGVPAQPQGQQQQEYRDPRLDNLLAQAEQTKNQRAEEAKVQARTAIETFSKDPAHEFFTDVRGLMADILDVADKQGFTLTLKEAYDRAVRIHPETSRIVEQRLAAQSVQNPARSTAKARAAASSVTGSPSPSGPAPTRGTLRDDLNAAIDQIASR